MANQLYNRVRFTTPTVGTGAITVGSAVAGFRTPAQASIPDQTTVTLWIEDGTNWELSTAVYTAASASLSRTFVDGSTGALLNLSGSAQAFIEPAAADLTQSAAAAAISAIAAKSANYQTASSDLGAEFQLSGGITLTIGAASISAGSASKPWYCSVRVTDASVCTITPASGTIDGKSSIKVYPNESFWLACDGTNCTTIGRQRGWVPIGVTVISGSPATVDFTQPFSDPELNSVKFNFSGLISTGAGFVAAVRVQKNATWQAGATYYGGDKSELASGSTNDSGTNAQNSVVLCTGQVLTGSTGLSGELEVDNIQGTTGTFSPIRWRSILGNAGSSYVDLGSAYESSNYATTGLRFVAGTAGWGGGTVRVSGRRD